MDREALNDYPMGRYDVTVTTATFVPDREIAWTVLGEIRPPIGHVYGYALEPVGDGTLVTSYYDWSSISPAWKEAGIFPVISEGALRATLGILARISQRTGAGSGGCVVDARLPVGHRVDGQSVPVNGSFAPAAQPARRS